MAPLFGANDANALSCICLLVLGRDGLWFSSSIHPSLFMCLGHHSDKVLCSHCCCLSARVESFMPAIRVSCGSAHCRQMDFEFWSAVRARGEGGGDQRLSARFGLSSVSVYARAHLDYTSCLCAGCIDDVIALPIVPGKFHHVCTFARDSFRHTGRETERHRDIQHLWVGLIHVCAGQGTCR
jgi:hypothetical protein